MQTSQGQLATGSSHKLLNCTWSIEEYGIGIQSTGCLWLQSLPHYHQDTRVHQSLDESEHRLADIGYAQQYQALIEQMPAASESIQDQARVDGSSECLQAARRQWSTTTVISNLAIARHSSIAAAQTGIHILVKQRSEWPQDRTDKLQRWLGVRTN
jgi:hypothetical protein